MNKTLKNAGKYKEYIFVRLFISSKKIILKIMNSRATGIGSLPNKHQNETLWFFILKPKISNQK